jgi:hypothetical protein
VRATARALQPAQRKVHVPARKRPVFAANGIRCAPQPGTRALIARIVARREQLVADIARLRERGEESRLIDNAQQLLTRWWSKANWRSREELLKSAVWLVELQKCRGEMRT